MFATALISLIFAWWGDESKILLLKQYNGYWYNPDSVSFRIEYNKVLPKNIDRVKTPEISHVGIAWPLKAIFIFVIYLPILLLVYFLNNLIDRMKKEK